MAGPSRLRSLASPLLAAAILAALIGCSKPGPASSQQTSAAVTSPVAANPSAADRQSPMASNSRSDSALTPKFSLDLQGLALPSGIGLTADQKGRPDQALAFSGEKTKIELDWDINATVSPQLTITAWARFQGNPSLRAQAQVVSHDDGTYDRSLGLDGRAGQWGWSAFAGSGGVMGGAPVQPDEWTFLAVTYDQTAKSAQLRVGDTVYPAKDCENDPGKTFVWLGGNPSYDEFFQGDIAHVQIFDRVLSQSELKAVEEQ